MIETSSFSRTCIYTIGGSSTPLVRNVKPNQLQPLVLDDSSGINRVDIWDLVEFVARTVHFWGVGVYNVHI